MIGLLALALLLVFLSVAVHAVAVAHLTGRLKKSPRLQALNMWRSHVLLLFIVFTVLLASHLTQAVFWAIAYLAIGGFPNMEVALYYSLSSYTTVGYADVVLPEHLRLLGPLESATGVLMFGWSTGYIFAFFARMLSIKSV
jgi:uncharacterized protein YhhL (DUF1145 family)